LKLSPARRKAGGRRGAGNRQSRPRSPRLTTAGLRADLARAAPGNAAAEPKILFNEKKSGPRPRERGIRDRLRSSGPCVTVTHRGRNRIPSLPPSGAEMRALARLRGRGAIRNAPRTEEGGVMLRPSVDNRRLTGRSCRGY
jgi:hypothetical protein